MSFSYNPANWYWRVGADTTRYYSSAVIGYVASVPAGFTPTRIASEIELWDVLDKYGVPLPVGATLSDAAKTERLTMLDKVALQIAFNHENRIRALESKAAITMAQFKTAIKAFL